MKQEEVWDRIARPWQDFRHYSVSDVVEFLKGKDGKVLDLGCGSGRNFMGRNELEFYGIDFSVKMVELAKERGYVEVKKGDVSEIPYEDGFFDYVVFSVVLHCVDSAEKRRKALGEVYRVLRDGGEMMITVWGRGSGRVKNKPKECFVPWSRDGGKVERYTYIYDKDELREDLESVGFEVVREWEDGNLGFVVRRKK
ncbi:methyltransferase domain-containing protein [Methanococcoides sp. SA1]|nr:methyltransferase domain-containing protein [Methanococcoides sp. SA1]